MSEENPNPQEPQKKKTAAQLQIELEAAQAKIVELQTQKTESEEDEKLITEKMTRGVTRAQAIAAIKRQRDFDSSEYGQMVKDRHDTRQAGKVWKPKPPTAKAVAVAK